MLSLAVTDPRAKAGRPLRLKPQQVHARVYLDHFAGDVAGVVGGHEGDSRGDLFDIGRPAVKAATEFVNTILAGNTALKGPDCDGAFDSRGNNLIGNTGACLFTPASGDIMGTTSQPVDPRLAPLRDNGGPTQTQELLPGSPAIDGGGAGSALETDQRGEPRPQGQAPDIGAFER